MLIQLNVVSPHEQYNHAQFHARRGNYLCLIQDLTPKVPDGQKCRGGYGGRLHGTCGEVEDPDNDNPLHRMCPACFTA